MKIMKYIIDKKGNPIIFGKNIIHKSIGAEVKSAGYIILRCEKETSRIKAKCFGRSDSLGKGPLEGDESLIESYMNLSRMVGDCNVTGKLRTSELIS